MKSIRLVGVEELQEYLAACPLVRVFLGRYYCRLAANSALSEDLVPLDWAETESDLEAIASRVEGLRVHWQQNPVGRPKADLYAALAEIEGFRVLLTKQYDRVYALPFKPIKGRGAPDALAERAGTPHLYEMKSLWAYYAYMRRDFRRLPTGAYGFGKRPPGRSVPDAIRLHAKSEAGDLSDNDYNTLILDLRLCSLLSKASAQLRRFTEVQTLGDCPKTIMLVVTEPGRILDVVRVGKDLASDWFTRHRDKITDVEWVSGGCSVSLGSYVSSLQR